MLLFLADSISTPVLELLHHDHQCLVGKLMCLNLPPSTGFRDPTVTEGGASTRTAPHTGWQMVLDGPKRTYVTVIAPTVMYLAAHFPVTYNSQYFVLRASQMAHKRGRRFLQVCITDATRNPVSGKASPVHKFLTSEQGPLVNVPSGVFLHFT